MEENVVKERLQEWIKQLDSDDLDGFVAMSIFKDQSCSACVDCSSPQLAIMLVTLSQNVSSLEKAITAAAKVIQMKGGQQ